MNGVVVREVQSSTGRYATRTVYFATRLTVYTYSTYGIYYHTLEVHKMCHVPTHVCTVHVYMQ